MTPVTIVKLGGSAITNKTAECTPDLACIRSSVRQLSLFNKPLVLLHGAGSYGHLIVNRAQLQEGLRRKSQLRALGETELCLDQLARIVQVSLFRENMRFVPLRAMSFLTMKAGRVEDLFIEPVRRAIKVGLIPVIHGDIAFDSKKGVSVISADQLASRIGTEFNGSRVLFGCDVDGVFKENTWSSGPRETINVVDRNNARQVLKSLRKSAEKDVTGGMYGKVREALTLARRGRASFIFNLKKKGMLAKALAGNLESGTSFPPWTS
jgi:isopentenyl phosphate kinase